MKKLYLCDRGTWCGGSGHGCCGGECNHTSDPKHSQTLKTVNIPQFEAFFFNKEMYWIEIKKY